MKRKKNREREREGPKAAYLIARACHNLNLGRKLYLSYTNQKRHKDARIKNYTKYRPMSGRVGCV